MIFYPNPKGENYWMLSFFDSL